MIYLSLLDLNLRHPEARKDIANCERLKHRIYSLFGLGQHAPRGHPRVLYRLEERRVLLQSGFQPDWSMLPTNYLVTPDNDLGFDDQVPCKRIDQSVAKLRAGTVLAFRLLARPEVVPCSTDKARPILTHEGALAWLLRKGDLHGFSLPLSEGRPNVRAQAGRSAPGERTGEFHTMLFEGVLQVSDPEKFAHAVAMGVGRHRAWGMGLLSLARLRQ